MKLPESCIPPQICSSNSSAVLSPSLCPQIISLPPFPIQTTSSSLFPHSLTPSLHLSLSCLVPLNTFFLPYVSASSAFSPETLFDPQLIPIISLFFYFFYIFLFLHSSYFIFISATWLRSHSQFMIDNLTGVTLKFSCKTVQTTDVEPILD